MDKVQTQRYLPKLGLITTLIICQELAIAKVILAQISTPVANPNLSQQVPPRPVDTFTPRLLPVGLIVNDRTKLESFSVLGQENGTDAVKFDDWLIPFDELAQALGFKIKEKDN